MTSPRIGSHWRARGSAYPAVSYELTGIEGADYVLTVATVNAEAERAGFALGQAIRVELAWFPARGIEVRP